MNRRLALLGAAMGLVGAVAGTVTAEKSFYRGKTVRIVVGFTAGGGFDTYARTIARHMSHHIPGNPTIIVENMPGAGSLIAANYLYKLAKPDGLTIGHFIGGLLLSQVPLAINHARTEEGRRILEVAVHNDSQLVRTFTLPPGTPRDRVQMLRRAFQATMKDPAFLADAERAKLEIDPVSGEEIERTVANLFKLDPALVATLKTVLLE